MPKEYLLEMPWPRIVKRIVKLTIAVAILQIGATYLVVLRDRADKLEDERPRWTDANRWEK